VGEVDGDVVLLGGVATDRVTKEKAILSIEANLEVIRDADKIYSGQAIRIPELVV